MKKKLLALGLCLLILLPALSGCGQKDNAAEIVMYDGINTEMQLVHRMIKLLVEDRTDAAVTIKDQMSGVNMFKEMTGNKSCDLFNSYDGTLLTTFLKLDPADVPEGVSLYDFANEQAMERYGVRLLDQLGIRDYFDVFIGREAAGRSKPFPDLYEEAMRRLGVKPEEAVVLEDSSNGIRAGLDAGCYVLAYKGAKVKQDTAGAHRTVYGYGEIDLEELEREVSERKGL